MRTPSEETIDATGRTTTDQERPAVSACCVPAQHDTCCEAAAKAACCAPAHPEGCGCK